MNRRGFIGSILAAASAPAIIRVASLMPIVVPHHAKAGLGTLYLSTSIEAVLAKFWEENLIHPTEMRIVIPVWHAKIMREVE